MPMCLTLSYNGETIISHHQTTWWITGFNSNYLNVNAENLSARFVIYFPSSGMYNAFASSIVSDSRWSFDPLTYSASFSF